MGLELSTPLAAARVVPPGVQPMSVTASRWRIAVVAGLLTVASVSQNVTADPPVKKAVASDAATPTVRPPSPIAPRSNVLTPEPWKGVPIAPLSAAELDKLIAGELREDHLKPAPRTTDEAFLRRVNLDITGR